MKCPKCGSENVHVSIEKTKQGFSGGKGCCGWILMGPIGLLCGLCGKNKVKSEEKYWLCNNCGAQFTDYEAMSTGGGVSYVSNKQTSNRVDSESFTGQQAQAPDNKSIAIPKITYGGHISNGHIVSAAGKIFYSRQGGLCVYQDGEISIVHKDFPTFLLTDGDNVYFPHNKMIARMNATTYEIDYISPLNIYVNTFIHLHNGIFAFANPNDKDKLYIMNRDGTNIKKLTDDRARFITISGDWVYYINSDDKNAIYRVNLNGSQRSKLFGDVQCSDLICDGNYLYCHSSSIFNLKDDGQLYMMNIDGTNAKIISNNVKKYIVTDTGIITNICNDEYEKAIFIPFDDINKQVLLIQGEKVNCINIDNEYLYYGVNGVLAEWITHRLNLTNGTIENI